MPTMISGAPRQGHSEGYRKPLVPTHAMLMSRPPCERRHEQTQCRGGDSGSRQMRRCHLLCHWFPCQPPPESPVMWHLPSTMRLLGTLRGKGCERGGAVLPLVLWVLTLQLRTLLLHTGLSVSFLRALPNHPAGFQERNFPCRVTPGMSRTRSTSRR